MLSAAVESGKRFFIKQDSELMLNGDFFHEVHDQQIVIDRHVGFFKHRGALVLAGSHLVVAGQNRDANLQGFQLKLLHEILNPYRDGTKIMVFHLLSFGRLPSKDGSADKQQVRAGVQKFLIHQEILLLPAQGGKHVVNLLIEIMANRGGSLV